MFTLNLCWLCKVWFNRKLLEKFPTYLCSSIIALILKHTHTTTYKSSSWLRVIQFIRLNTSIWSTLRYFKWFLGYRLYPTIFNASKHVKRNIHKWRQKWFFIVFFSRVLFQYLFWCMNYLLYGSIYSETEADTDK